MHENSTAVVITFRNLWYIPRWHTVTQFTQRVIDRGQGLTNPHAASARNQVKRGQQSNHRPKPSFIMKHSWGKLSVCAGSPRPIEKRGTDPRDGV